MKYRLRVKVSKRNWKTGLNVYDTMDQAKARQKELKVHGIESIIVDEFGCKIR
jgi:hypothetical protein